jgi:hypothetical protein
VVCLDVPLAPRRRAANRDRAPAHLTYDPGRGITCWDENALAEVRRYQSLSLAVGLIVLRSATRDWADAASRAPIRTVINHPQFGALGAVEIIRRNAHEVRHHLMDIDGYRDR